MKALKCGSQTNLLPPQVEQKPSLTQIRLAVVFGGGMSLAWFCFQTANLSYAKLPISPCSLPKDFSQPTPFAKRSPETTEAPPPHPHPPAVSGSNVC